MQGDLLEPMDATCQDNPWTSHADIVLPPVLSLLAEQELLKRRPFPVLYSVFPNENYDDEGHWANVTYMGPLRLVCKSWRTEVDAHARMKYMVKGVETATWSDYLCERKKREKSEEEGDEECGTEVEPLHAWNFLPSHPRAKAPDIFSLDHIPDLHVMFTRCSTESLRLMSYNIRNLRRLALEGDKGHKAHRVLRQLVHLSHLLLSDCSASLAQKVLDQLGGRWAHLTELIIGVGEDVLPIVAQRWVNSGLLVPQAGQKLLLIHSCTKRLRVPWDQVAAFRASHLDIDLKMRRHSPTLLGLADNMAKMCQLKSLKLELSPLDSEMVMQALHLAPNLQALDLHGSLQYTLDTGMLPPGLTSLQLMVDRVHWWPLKLRGLEELALGVHLLRPGLRKEIVDSLEHLTNLRVLRYSGQADKTERMDPGNPYRCPLPPGLAKLPHLEHLHIDAGIIVEDEGDVLGELQQLKSLRFSTLALQNIDAPFANLKQLECLSLVRCFGLNVDDLRGGEALQVLELRECFPSDVIQMEAGGRSIATIMMDCMHRYLVNRDTFKGLKLLRVDQGVYDGSLELSDSDEELEVLLDDEKLEDIDELDEEEDDEDLDDEDLDDEDLDDGIDIYVDEIDDVDMEEEEEEGEDGLAVEEGNEEVEGTPHQL